MNVRQNGIVTWQIHRQMQVDSRIKLRRIQVLSWHYRASLAVYNNTELPSTRHKNTLHLNLGQRDGQLSWQLYWSRPIS